jgi:hypothetical protein
MRLFANVVILLLSTQSAGFTCVVNESDLDAVQEKHAKELKEVRTECYVLENKTACKQVAASKEVPLPAMVSTPELMDEVHRANARCKNWSRIFDYWMRKINMLDRPMARVVKPAHKATPVKAILVKAVSNPMTLEIKLRDYVLSKIGVEVSKHLDGIELSSNDLKVLSTLVCEGSSKPVTSSLIKHIRSKSKKKIDEFCIILKGGAR